MPAWSVVLVLASSLLALAPLLYRIAWSRRFGRRGVDGAFVRLRGRLAGPGQPGEPLHGRRLAARQLVVRAGGEARLVDASSPLLVVHGPLRIGDPVTADGHPGASPVEETLYRDSALRPALIALRLSRGTWPELRLLDLCVPLFAAAAIATAALAPRPRIGNAELGCPPGTLARGAAPPRDFMQWCGAVDGEGADRRELKQGPQAVWWSSTQLRQLSWYADGQLDGLSTSWHENGRIAERGQYLRGRLVGEWWSWRPDGGLRVHGGFDHAGARHGTWTWFQPNGKLRLLVEYDHGVKDGLWQKWHPSGVLAERTWHKRGYADGPFHRWGPSGRLVEFGAFKGGLWVDTRSSWDRRSRPISSLLGSR
jgi:hypothetical protein